MAWLVFFLGLLLLGCVGCGQTREAARAAVMADQSLQAAQDQFEREPMPLNQGADAMVAWAVRAYDRVVIARKLLAPVVARLSIGYTAADLDTGTIADNAAKDPAAFDAKAVHQVKLAEAEVGAAGFWDRLGVIARGLLKTTLETGLGVGLLGTGGGAALVLLGKGFQLYQKSKAVGDEAITYGVQVTNELRRVGGSEKLATIQKDAIERQVKRGVWRQVDAKAKAAKAAAAKPVEQAKA